MKKLMTLILLLGCLPGCSLLNGGKPNVDNLCNDTKTACVVALQLCETTEPTAATKKALLQCSQVAKVCDQVTAACAQK